MISKNEVKYIQSLFHKKTRNAAAVFIAEGNKIVDELNTSDFEVVKIYALKDFADLHRGLNNLVEVSEIELEKISQLKTPNQAVAIVRKKKINDSLSFKGNITLMLDNIQDPGNLGTIIRIADWFGIKQIIASQQTADVYNPKVIQSSMGSFLRTNIHYADLEIVLKENNVPVFGALLNGEKISSFSGISEGIIIIGNESNGISKKVLPFIQHAITIPGKGGAESLNAAVATGIILSHLITS